MSEAEYLIGLSQIALGLTGFTGVVVAFRNNASEWPEVDRMRFSLLLASSITSIFTTLLPLALNGLGLEPPRLWRIASLILALCFITIAFFYYRRLHRLKDDEYKDVSIHLTIFLSLGSLISILLQLLNASGVFGAPFGVFLLGLLWGLFVPAVQFGRMIYIHFVKPPSNKKKQ